MADKRQKVLLGTQLENSLPNCSEEVLKNLYNNFVKPIKQGYFPKELQGKYKPSWMISPAVSNKMKVALADFARQNQLHHYHFGHRFYITGRDPHFPGDESDGILHIQQLEKEDSTVYAVIRIDETHPTPFTCPFDLSISATYL